MTEINWKNALPELRKGKDFEDITYKKCNGVARIAFNRPNVRNAFRPNTTSELYQAFYDAHHWYSFDTVNKNDQHAEEQCP